MTREQKENQDVGENRMDDLEKLTNKELAERIVELEKRLGGKDASDAFLRGELLQAGSMPSSSEINFEGHKALLTAFQGNRGDMVSIVSSDMGLEGKKVKIIIRDAQTGEQLEDGIISMDQEKDGEVVGGDLPMTKYATNFTIEFKMEK